MPVYFTWYYDFILYILLDIILLILYFIILLIYNVEILWNY